MTASTRKRILAITSAALLTISIAAICIYRINRSVRSTLMQNTGFVSSSPQKALSDIDRIDRTFLTESNYMLCDLLKAGALVNTEEYVVSDSLLDFVMPYYKYTNDSLHLTEIYYYKGEIARSSNFLLEAIEYFTLCTQYNSGAYDLRELNFYLNNFKGQAYHFKRMSKQEKIAKLEALSFAKALKNPKFVQEAYSELTHYFAQMENCPQSIPLLKEAAEQGYTGSLQARILYLLSEQYTNLHQPDSALLYTRQIPHLYQDSIDYLLGKIYMQRQQNDSARLYLNRSSQSSNPALCLKSYRQLIDLNIHTGSMSGVSQSLEQFNRYRQLTDSIENHENLSKAENVERLRKTIRDSEAAEAAYYHSWIVNFWIMVAAFICILILMSVSVILQKKKRDLQLKRQQARLDALKMQIDPHFIFNNLSILLDLVETGDITAPIYIKCLSKVYRHIVANADKNLSTVAEELASLEPYIFLLKIRFEDTIQIEVQVEGAIRERQIPPITLQMLVENAIKHNQASEEAPLLIRIYSDGDKLVVENNRKPLVPSTSTHHIGLRNIRERYKLTGAPAPDIFENEHLYRVTLSTLHIKQ